MVKKKSETSKPAETTETKQAETTAQNQQPALMIHSQYVKDLSLEIPLAPEIFAEATQAPNVQIDFSINTKKLQNNTFNVALTIKVDADVANKKLFIVELTYAAIATLNVPQEAIEPLLFIELPRLLFPFARSIIANNLTEAGLPPLMLTPIDFVALYNSKKAQVAAAAAAKAEK